MCELNPLQSAWAGVKRYVGDSLSLKTIQGVIKCSDINKWKGYVNHVKKGDWIVAERWANGGSDSFFISVGGIESRDEDKDSNQQQRHRQWVCQIQNSLVR